MTRIDRTPLVCLMFTGLFALDVSAQQFATPDINQPARDFMNRFETNSINVDFIIADTLGKVGRRIRNDADIDGIDPTQDVPDQEELDRQINQRLAEQGVTSVADSILISPGADIGNLTIVDTGDDTAIAIGR